MLTFFFLDSLPIFFFTSLNFGENVEDEWFTVYLMLEISKEIPDVIIRVWDSDGEFLLIEAAEHLPQWCNPESCCGKVKLFVFSLNLTTRFNC